MTTPEELAAFMHRYVDVTRDVADVRDEFGLSYEAVDAMAKLGVQARKRTIGRVSLRDAFASFYLIAFETGYRWCEQNEGRTA